MEGLPATRAQRPLPFLGQPSEDARKGDRLILFEVLGPPSLHSPTFRKLRTGQEQKVNMITCTHFKTEPCKLLVDINSF